MYNSCKIWNNENLSNEVIAEHLTILSKGKLQIEGSEITVSADASNFVQRRPFKSNNNFRKNNNNKNNKNRGSGKNQRRF
jgi:ribosome-binding protein aMBF1 (putative translation factor)